MPRESGPGGEDSLDQVDIHLRVLARLQRSFAEEAFPERLSLEASRSFADALGDGLVLCQ